MISFLSGFFKLKERGTDFKTEVLAGITTFLTMAYILIVNPLILGDAGMDIGAVFTATAISSAVATFVMAIVANLPVALAPGMGLNAFFAYTVVIGMGFSWQMALAAVFIEGIIFIVLSLLNVREAIINSIPNNVKKAVAVGIGLFIALIGLQNAGIVVPYPPTMVTLGDMSSPNVLLALIGIVLAGSLLALKVKGALLISILGTTLLGFLFGVTNPPTGNFLPPSLAPTFLQFDFTNLFTAEMLIVIFTFLFIDLFDTAGTLIGVASKGKMLDSNGKLPQAKQALLSDAIGTTVGAALGTSTVTSYIESASGISEGGKTGLTSLTVGALFLVSLFLSPLFLMVPAAATASALVIVGLFMMSAVSEIDFSDFTEAIPAFLTIIMMPFTFSISEGIVFGIMSYVLLKTFTGKWKQVSILSYVLFFVFIAWFIFM